MTNSLILSQSTKLVGQIIDDLERLKEEFLDLNLEEIFEKYPETMAISFLALNNIRANTSSAFLFLESMKKAKDENDSGTA